MRFLLSGAAALALVAPLPALAQDHTGHKMPAPTPTPTPTPPPVDHSTMDHSQMDPATMDVADPGYDAMTQETLA